MESKNAGTENGLSIQDFLRKRDEISKAIQEKFQRQITVMFTDIVSSTDFFEIHGDLEGRAMVQRHNDILYPIIEKHGGRVIKPLGDGLMISFEDAGNASRAAVEIQKTLSSENEGKPPVDQIWVKISIHYDKGIVEATDVYGDVVNTSARISSLSKKGQILVSQAYIDSIKDQPDIEYDYFGSKTLKGKAAAVEIYRIIWDPAQEVDSRRAIEKGAKDAAVADVHGDRQTLWLDFSLEGDRIRLIAYRSGEQDQTVKQVKEFPYKEKEIRSLLEQMNQCLSAVDQKGKSSKENLAALKDLSGRLYRLLLPGDVEKLFLGTPVHSLVLQLDDRLVYIPWELLYDGNQFLCIRYIVGRLVSTSREIVTQKRDIGQGALKMLVVTNPRGDLPATGPEGSAIHKEFNKNPDLLSVDLHDRKITHEFLQAHLSDYDLFHYAGHSDYDQSNPSQSGLLLTNGKFESGRLLELAKEHPLPSLVFTNACQSSRTENWRSGEHLYGLANAFLMSGVRHYIGSTMDLFDRSSAAFAQEFYTQLIKNQSIGEALRQARMKSITRYGEENFTWAFYVLYGDPSFQYFKYVAAPVTRQILPIETKYSAKMIAIAAMVVLLLAGALLGKNFWSGGGSTGGKELEQGFSLVRQGRVAQAQEFFQAMEGKSPLYHQGMFAVYMNRGDLKNAEMVLPLLQSDQPDSAYLPVANAHMTLARGKLGDAEAAYRSALETGNMESWQRAEALFGLGRVLLNKGDLPQATEAFDQALKIDPSFVQAYTAKGLALERQGKAQEALDMYEKATTINKDDSINAALHRRTKERLAFEQETERKKRVDALVADLVQAYREGRGQAKVEDEWSSRPLYFFLLDLQTKGQPGMREGEDEFLQEQIIQELSVSGRLNPVERALMDKLLEELKLSSTQLVDQQTALRLGKILSARIITAGSVLRFGGDTQVSLRAIDAETSRVMGMVTESLKPGEDLPQMVSKLSANFSKKVHSAYPIRGRVKEAQNGEAIINIGALTGVTPGMRLQVLERDGKGLELEVREVSDQTSTAVFTPKEVAPQVGWRVEEIKTPS